MARVELQELYRVLTDARFEFVPQGETPLRAVYAIVKKRYPELCDDTYLCSTNCKSPVNQPEWKHVVRTALNEMKKQGEPIAKGDKWGVWIFGRTAPSETAAREPVFEGRVLLRLHKRKERKPRVVHAKKRSVLASTGHLACEVCGFNFVDVYGPRGDGFAECHHRVPLEELDGTTPTVLADLAVVCANCHRMLHRVPLVTVEELRAIVEARRIAEART